MTLSNLFAHTNILFIIINTSNENWFIQRYIQSRRHIGLIQQIKEYYHYSLFYTSAKPAFMIHMLCTSQIK